MKRIGMARWSGDLKSGKGTLAVQSALHGGPLNNIPLNNIPYSYTTRFEKGAGTNPEELIAAAHAACFTMAVSAFLGRAGFTPDKLATKATLTMEQIEGNWTISAIHLELNGRVPEIGPEKFQEIAAEAKEKCPVSRVLNAKITLEAKLVDE